jgi:hypothetical protein
VDAVEVKADELKFADHDLTFVELFVTEPIFDMARLFGAEGLIPPTSSHIRLAVQSAQRSATWGQASDRLHQLHRLLHEDLTVLPLWQLPEYYAYRKNLQGIEPKLIALYQDVDRWRVSSRLLANK